MKKLSIFILALGLWTPPIKAAVYKIDPAHSSVSFRIRHLVGRVSGRFDKAEGEFAYEKDKPAAWTASASIDAASIDTHNEKRDEHLRSADFFDAAKCPSITFKSAKVAEAKGDSFKLLGDLTMHCVTKPVALDVEFNGVTKDPWGNMRAGAVATGKLNRKDFGIVWNKTLDAGGLMLGDEVEITLEIEAVAPGDKK